ncbi:hypothetical protein HPB47_003444, partial [Ixodes persulcatus]
MTSDARAVSATQRVCYPDVFVVFIAWAARGHLGSNRGDNVIVGPVRGRRCVVVYTSENVKLYTFCSALPLQNLRGKALLSIVFKALVGGQECSMGEEDFPALGDSMRPPAWGKPNRVGDVGCRPKGGQSNAPAALGETDGRPSRPPQQPRLAAQFLAPSGRSPGLGRGTDLGVPEQEKGPDAAPSQDAAQRAAAQGAPHEPPGRQGREAKLPAKMNPESTDQLMLAVLQDIADSGTSFKDGYQIPPKEPTADAMTCTSSTIVSACDDDDMLPDDDEFETAQGKKRRKTDPRCHASSLKDEGNLQVGCTVLYTPTENHKVESLSKLKLTDYLNNVAPGM